MEENSNSTNFNYNQANEFNNNENQEQNPNIFKVGTEVLFRLKRKLNQTLFEQIGNI